MSFDQRNPRLVFWVICALLLTGVALSLCHLGALPLWEDEIRQIEFALDLRKSRWAGEYFLFSGLLRPFLSISQDPGWLRLVSVLWFPLAAWFLYRAVRQFDPGRHVAHGVALLFLFHPFVQFQIRQVRPAGLILTLTMAAFFAAGLLLKTRRFKYGVLFAVLMSAAVAISQSAALILPAALGGGLAWLLLNPQIQLRNRKLLGALFAALVALGLLVLLLGETFFPWHALSGRGHHLVQRPNNYSLTQALLWPYLLVAGPCVLPFQWPMFLSGAAWLTCFFRAGWERILRPGILGASALVGTFLFGTLWFYGAEPRYLLFLMPIAFWVFVRGWLLLGGRTRIAVTLALVLGWGAHYWNYFHRQNFVYSAFLEDFPAAFNELCPLLRPTDRLMISQRNHTLEFSAADCATFPSYKTLSNLLDGSTKDATAVAQAFFKTATRWNAAPGKVPQRYVFMEVSPGQYDLGVPANPQKLLNQNREFKNWLKQWFHETRVLRYFPQQGLALKSRLVHKPFVEYRFVVTFYERKNPS